MDQLAKQVADESNVYTGAWINWSRGQVAGATVTLTRQDGQLLTAFLALFVTIAGTSFFRIICFGLHWFLSSKVPQDAIYHQTQAILRNSTTGANGLWNFLQLAWAWKTHRRMVLGRVLPVIACAALISSAFSVASIFVSQVSTSTGGDVLLKGSNCIAYYIQQLPLNFTSLSNSYWTETGVAGLNHARYCYNGNALEQNCKTYIKDSLHYSKRLNASCPFSDQMCLQNSSVLQLDTGYLDSHDDFGINAAPDHRFSYRSVATCAPLRRDGYVRTNSIPDNEDNVESSYFYGPMGRTITDPSAPSWIAFQEPVLGADLSFNFSDYSVWALAYRGGLPDNEQTEWLPIPELHLDDANIAIVSIIGHSIIFTQQIDDPIFSAHRPAGVRNVNSQWPDSRQMTYFSDNTDGIMGCTMQHQICDPRRPQETACTPLTAAASLRPALNQTLSSKQQRTDAEFLVSLVVDATIELVDLIQMLGVTALDARNAFYGSYSNPLPDNQWEKEVELWWQGTLASLQLLVTEQATGPSMTEAQQLFTKPKTKEEKRRCTNQKIRNTAYTSFSTLGLTIIFSLGSLFIILSYTLESCVARIQRKHNLDGYHRLEWATNGTLQLQRLAHEQLGLGTWTEAAADVPVVVEAGAKLAMVDVSNVDHPMLLAPTETLEGQVPPGKTSAADAAQSGKVFPECSPVADLVQLMDKEFAKGVLARRRSSV